LDTQIKDENIVVGHLRVILSTDQIERTMSSISILFILFIPVYIIIVVMGSLSIAGAALKPIDRVIQTAQKISQLDLSKRIDVQGTDDEIGRLIVDCQGNLNTFFCFLQIEMNSFGFLDFLLSFFIFIFRIEHFLVELQPVAG